MKLEKIYDILKQEQFTDEQVSKCIFILKKVTKLKRNIKTRQRYNLLDKLTDILFDDYKIVFCNAKCLYIFNNEPTYYFNLD